MKADYKTALKVEMIVSHCFDVMEKQGAPVDVDRMEEVFWHISENKDAMEEHIVPQVPMVADSGNWAVVESPFTKAGKLSAQANWCVNPMKIYDSKIKKLVDFAPEVDTEQEVMAPFCKVRWVRINLNSDKQVKAFIRTLGWKPTEWNVNKKTGTVTGPKLTEDSYDSIQGDVGREIGLYLKLSHRYSLVKGLINAVWYDSAGQARVSQIVSGMTPTYRCTHKVLVNIPNEDSIMGLAIRSMFVAPEGYEYLGVDAKSCQLRMLCHYMGDPIYTEAVMHGKSSDGTDIHSVNMGMTEGLLTKRSQAKRFIYGLLFGAGDPKLGAILGGDKHDGKHLRKVFMDRLPTLQDLLDRLKKSWKARGYIVGLDGRKVYIRSEHMLLVYLVQSAEAILMRWVLALLYTWGFFNKFDVQLAIQSHDEYQFVIRKDQTEEATAMILEAFKQANQYLKLTVPADGDPKHGKSWDRTH